MKTIIILLTVALVSSITLNVVQKINYNLVTQSDINANSMHELANKKNNGCIVW